MLAANDAFLVSYSRKSWGFENNSLTFRGKSNDGIP